MAGANHGGPQTETATLLENGEIQVLVVTSSGGATGHGGFNLKPGDSEYDEYKRRFGLVKAGDWKSIEREFRDGKWVDLPTKPKADLPLDGTSGKLL